VIPINLSIDVDESVMESVVLEETYPIECYGLPDRKAYPMPDKKHVLSAIKFFNYAKKNEEKELAKNINAKIKEYGITDINVGNKNRFKKYYIPVGESFSLPKYLSAMQVLNEQWEACGGKDRNVNLQMKSILELFYRQLEVGNHNLTESDVKNFKEGIQNALMEVSNNLMEASISNGLSKNHKPGTPLSLSKYKKIKSTCKNLKSKYPDVLKHVIDTADVIMWVDKVNRPVAMVAVNTHPDNTRWIVGLEIFGNYKDHGLSKQVLARAKSELGATHLSVNKKNLVAQKAYKSSFQAYDESDSMIYMKAMESSILPVLEADDDVTKVNDDDGVEDTASDYDDSDDDVYADTPTDYDDSDDDDTDDDTPTDYDDSDDNDDDGGGIDDEATDYDDSDSDTGDDTTGTDDNTDDNAGDDSGTDGSNTDDGGGIDDTPTDYDDSSDDTGDDSGDDSSDDTQDSGESDDDTSSDDSEEDSDNKRYDNKELKNYFLLNNFLSIHELEVDVLDMISGVVLPTPEANSILANVVKNLQTIRDFTERFIQFQFSGTDYAFNLYYYNVILTTLKMNLELLETAINIGDQSKSKQK
jgi:hypothetical protein